MGTHALPRGSRKSEGFDTGSAAAAFIVCKVSTGEPAHDSRFLDPYCTGLGIQGKQPPQSRFTDRHLFDNIVIL